MRGNVRPNATIAVIAPTKKSTSPVLRRRRAEPLLDKAVARGVGAGEGQQPRGADAGEQVGDDLQQAGQAAREQVDRPARGDPRLRASCRKTR